MENKSHALIAGLFTLLLGIALAVTAVWLGRDTTEKRFYELATRASVSGLSPQSDVRYRGLEVGKVQSITFDPAVAGQILVSIAIDPTTPVTSSTYATLGYQGVTGLAYIQLDDDGKSAVRLSPGSKVARIELRPGLLDKLTNGGEAIVADLQVTIHRINDMLGPSNQQALAGTLVSLNKAADKINDAVATVQPALQRLPATLDAAKATLVSVGSVAADYSALSRKLQASDGLLDKLNGSLEQFDATARGLTLSTLPHIEVLSSDASRSARSLAHAVDRLDERPQSLIFGAQPNVPGPGEAGFAPVGAH